MRIIVGLGNPGNEYEWTRHNLGFMLIDKLAADAGASVKRRECRSLVGGAVIEGERVKLVKPQTFMNLSGEAVACLIAKFDSPDAGKSLIIIGDDLALPFGTTRLRARGSAGGHNGLRSIIAALARMNLSGCELESSRNIRLATRNVSCWMNFRKRSALR